MHDTLEPKNAKGIADLLALGHVDRALVAAEAAHLHDPSDDDIMVALGRTYIASGQPARAAQLILRATTLKPDQAHDIYQLGLSLGLDHGLITDACGIIDAAIERYPVDPFIAGYAGALRFRSNPEDQSGVTLMRGAIQAEAFHWGPVYESYLQAMTHENRLEEAVDDLTLASQRLDQSHPWSSVHVSVLYHLALAQHALGKKSLVRETLSKIMSAAPEMESLLRPLIISSFADGDNPAANSKIFEHAEIVSDRIIKILSREVISQKTQINILESSAAISYLTSTQYRLLPVNRIGRNEVESLVSKGLSRDFIQLLKSGPSACLEAISKPESGKAWRSDFAVSDRCRDAIDTLDRGKKASLNPYTCKSAETQHMLASDTFYFYNNGDPYLVTQWAETDITLSDTFWILPRLKLIIYFQQSNILPSTAQNLLLELFHRTLANPEKIRDFLYKNIIKTVVSQHPIPHIGHYVWNGVSAWSSFFRYCVGDLAPDAIAYHGNLRLMADVTELYPQECEEINDVIVFENEAQSSTYSVDNDCMVLTLKSSDISEDLARRMTRWAWSSVSEEFAQELRTFKARCYPLLLINVRLDNRSWVDQRDGFKDLFNSLIKNHPSIGFIIDGINSGVTQGWTHAEMSVEPEYELASHLISSCSDVPILSSIGCSIAESLVIGDVCDSFVGHVGAGMAKYRWISNLPGVAFSNETFSRPRDRDGRLYDNHREAARKAMHVSLVDIVDVPGPKTSRSNFMMNSSALLAAVEKNLSLKN